MHNNNYNLHDASMMPMTLVYIKVRATYMKVFAIM